MFYKKRTRKNFIKIVTTPKIVCRLSDVKVKNANLKKSRINWLQNTENFFLIKTDALIHWQFRFDVIKKYAYIWTSP